MNTPSPDFHDPLTPPFTEEVSARFFDRFMFNMHPGDANAPSVITGFGHYPGRNVADGYVIISLPDQQRNVRFSTVLSDTDGNGAGPLRFKCIEPNRIWQLQLGPNPTNIEYEVRWQARTPYWLDVVQLENANEAPTHFEHLVQSGRYRGWISVDGATQSVDGWYGQRDRSRGVRTMRGGQGLHLWCQAQFNDKSIGFLLVENRDGARILLEGAVLTESGGIDHVVDAQHRLIFNDLDLVGGAIEVVTKSGGSYAIEADASAGGGYMAGAGYGGHHGKAKGKNHLEHDIYPLDGSVNQRSLDTSLTDRLTRFKCNGENGFGIFEFALSRSSTYRYRPQSR